MDRLKIIVIANDTDNRIIAKRLFDDERLAISAYVEAKQDSFIKIVGIYPDIVVFFDENPESDETAPNNILTRELAKRIYVSMPGTLLILISKKSDTEYLKTNMQSGFHMILPPCVKKEETLDSVINLSAVEKKRLTEEQRRVTNAKIISIFSAKGGCGKTTTAVNLSVCFVQKKKKTLIIDADFQFGDISLFLDLSVKDTISELVQEASNFTIDTINSFTVLHSCGLNILPAPKSPEMAEYITDVHMEKLISILRPYYDYIIIDLGSSIGNVALNIIENSDMVIYVTTPDITSIKDLHQTYKIMSSLQQADKFKMIINRFGTGTLKKKDFETNISMPILGTIREDEHRLALSIAKGVPIVLDAPRSKIALDIAAVYDKIIKSV
ncbi:MAG: AAA family ATPase [Oscillospiraceae bacterium]|nr:AAA family ATPase [Oscillospiraceae bacterium]